MLAIRTLIAITLVLPAIAGATALATPLEVIREAVVQALGGAVRSEDVAVSPQTRVAPCTKPLTAAPTNARTVEVRCDASPGWRIFVPVRVKQVSAVVVTTRPIRQGVPLGADQLSMQERDMAAIPGAGFTELQAVVGRVPKRGLPPGAVVRVSDLADAVMVKRGDAVTLVSRVGGIEVRAEGRATTSGALGSQVSAENLGSRRVVRGRVVEQGVVMIGQ